MTANINEVNLKKLLDKPQHLQYNMYIEMGNLPLVR